MIAVPEEDVILFTIYYYIIIVAIVVVEDYLARNVGEDACLATCPSVVAGEPYLVRAVAL